VPALPAPERGLSRRGALVFLAVALATVLMATGVAGARAAAPQPKLMALTTDDLGHGAVVQAQSFTTGGPIPASHGYQRSFTGVTLGKAHLFTLQDTVLVGKSKSAAAALISSILLASSSKTGRDALYLQSEKSFSTSAKMTVRSGAVTRAGEIKAGDSAVEIVFRFDTPTGSFQVGEIFVRVGGDLSTIYYGAGTPGVSQATARHLAQVSAKHMTDAGTTA
jgi:hypothetical protein